MTDCPIPGCTQQTTGFDVCEVHALKIAAQVAARKRSTPAHKTAGWIYFLLLDEKVKIGWTANLTQRMKSYPPHARMVTNHPGTRADERDLHRTFTPSRASGREWYHQTPELLAHIETVRLAEIQRKADEHMAWLSAEAAEEEAMNAAWPGSAALRIR